MPTHEHHHQVRQRAKPIEVVTEDLVAKVEGWRRQRMSWTAIGRNLGVNAEDARKRFEHPQPKGTQP
jgi:hypothetical protein